VHIAADISRGVYYRHLGCNFKLMMLFRGMPWLGDLYVAIMTPICVFIM
jgi:hypothetical protein